MKTIFYVEDNQDFLDLVTGTIPKDYHCIPFTDPQAASDKIFAGEHPDLVITDLKMPKTSGIEFITQIRAYGYRGPIIVATGNIEREEMIIALRMGVCDILDKPFTLDAFHAALARSEHEREQVLLQKSMAAKLHGVINCLEEVVASMKRTGADLDQNAQKLMDLAELFKEEFQQLAERDKRLRMKSPIDDIFDPLYPNQTIKS